MYSKTHQIAPFKKSFLVKRAPEPPSHASQATLRHATRPAPQKVGPPWQSYIRPWTTTKKFI